MDAFVEMQQPTAIAASSPDDPEPSDALAAVLDGRAGFGTVVDLKNFVRWCSCTE
jgi:hypothetical protein